jgi:two-component system, sensor histidine kinase and response regulator
MSEALYPNQNLEARPGPVRILVAEDNLISQRLISGLLANPRYKLTIVDNGREAVAAAKAGDFDLIFMDCRMPAMNGFDATNAIRQLASPARLTPIIALTADTLPGDRERCLEAGMDDYLAKPVSANSLISAVETWLARGKERLAATPEERSPQDRGPEIFNRQRLDALRSVEASNNTQFVDELIETFLLSTALDMSLLRTAVENSRAEEIFHLSHRLKASCGSLGLLSLEANFSALEVTGRAGELAGALKLLVLVERDLPAARSALFAQLSSGKQAA